MYVCVCHAFTDKQVKTALAEGAHNTASVYKTLGHKVQCGKCVPYVRGMVEEHRQNVVGSGAGLCVGGGACGGCGHDHPDHHHHDHPANEDGAIPYGVAAE